MKNTVANTAVMRDRKVRRTRCAEQTAGSTAAERGTHVRALAMLHQHQADDAQANEDMQGQRDSKNNVHE